MQNSNTKNDEYEKDKEATINKIKPNWTAVSYGFTVCFVTASFVIGYFLLSSTIDVYAGYSLFQYLGLVGIYGIFTYCVFVVISLFSISRKHSRTWGSFKVNLTMLIVSVLIYLVSLWPNLLKQLSSNFDITSAGALFITPNLDYLGTLLQFI